MSNSTQKTLSELQGLQQQSLIKKYSYLNPQYILRYEFTFKSMQWALVLGIFLGIHTQLRHRDIKKSFSRFLMGSVGFIFPLWAFFYTKFNFYQSSIQRYEQEQMIKIKKFQMFKRMAQYKLNLPQNHELDQQQLMKRYEDYLKDYQSKNCQLDIILEGVKANSYDLVKN